MDKHIVKNTSPARLIEISRNTYTVSKPFNPETTLHKPSHFPSLFDVIRKGEYLFATRVGCHEVGARAAHTRAANRVVMTVYIPETSAPPDNLSTIENELARRLGLTINIEGYEEIWTRDPILSRLSDNICGARPASPFSLYEFLVICTILQNTIVRRTVQMANALAENLGRAYQFPDRTIVRGFWEPSILIAFGESRLRELRLGYRARNLVRFSEQFCVRPDLETELLSLSSEPDRLRDRVKKFYGVGPASAGYIMFEWFKSLDEFHYVSPWERKILSRLLFDSYDAPASDIIQFCRSRWAPYTMLAVHAVFESVFWRRAQGQGPKWLDELIRL